METVKVRVELDILTHDGVKEHPFVNISVNGYPQWGEVCESSCTAEFSVDTNETNVLTVEYCNKDPQRDVVIQDGEIVADKRVTIQGISLDDIALDFHAFDEPDTLSYESFDPEGVNAEGYDASKLSWNGRTTLKFTSPIYIWLLENL